MVKKQVIKFGGDLDHHAACPIWNLAITEQIMSGFWWNFQDSFVMIYGTIDYNFLSDLDHHADSTNCKSGNTGVTVTGRN